MISVFQPAQQALGSSGYKKKRAREKETRERRACLPCARPFSLSPTTSKRLLRNILYYYYFHSFTVSVAKQLAFRVRRSATCPQTMTSRESCFVSDCCLFLPCVSEVVLTSYDVIYPVFRNIRMMSCPKLSALQQPQPRPATTETSCSGI